MSRTVTGRDDDSLRDTTIAELAEKVIGGYGSPEAAKDVAREYLRIVGECERLCKIITLLEAEMPDASIADAL